MSNQMGGDRIRLSAHSPGIGKADSSFLLEIRESGNLGTAPFTDSRKLICCPYTHKARQGSAVSIVFQVESTPPVQPGGVDAD